MPPTCWPQIKPITQPPNVNSGGPFLMPVSAGLQIQHYGVGLLRKAHWSKDYFIIIKTQPSKTLSHTKQLAYMTNWSWICISHQGSTVQHRHNTKLNCLKVKWLFASTVSATFNPYKQTNADVKDSLKRNQSDTFVWGMHRDCLCTWMPSHHIAHCFSLDSPLWHHCNIGVVNWPQITHMLRDVEQRRAKLIHTSALEKQHFVIFFFFQSCSKPHSLHSRPW